MTELKKYNGQYILVINCGSSSVKYRLFASGDFSSVSGGIIERIGDENSHFIYEHGASGKVQEDIPCENHYNAIDIITKCLTSPEKGLLHEVTQIIGVGHRAVHGGEKIHSSVIIDKHVIEVIKDNIELAPLHNPPGLLGISAAQHVLPHATHVAVFDTAFHQTIPEQAYLYAVPYELYTKYKIRKYGFHGTSHRFVTEECSRRLKRPAQKLRLITCHLGNGCSITAVRYGKSIDTSMGLTPLPGLVMGTRSGDIDPAIVFFLLKDCRMRIDQVDTLLNKKSGILGVSGISNDMRDINAAIAKGNRRARLAKDIFLYRLRLYIGMYAAVMDGVDAVVLTAGIGENDQSIARDVQRSLKNFLRKFNARVLVIPTNEESLIARDTYELITRNKKRRVNKRA